MKTNLKNLILHTLPLLIILVLVLAMTSCTKTTPTATSTTSTTTATTTTTTTTTTTATTTKPTTATTTTTTTSTTSTPSPPTAITVLPSPATMAVGDTKKFQASGDYPDGTNKNISSTVVWASSNTSIATISNTGEATAKAVGTTTITAAFGAVTSTGVTLTVNPGAPTTTPTVAPPDNTIASIAVTPNPATVKLGETLQLKATATYQDGSTFDITSRAFWTTSNSVIATVSDTGLAKGIEVSGVTITAGLAGVISPPIVLTVTSTTTSTLPPANTIFSVTITPDPASVKVGSTLQFKAMGTYQDKSVHDITSEVEWASSNLAIATISLTGLAKGIDASGVSITASYGGVTSRAVILTVTN